VAATWQQDKHYRRTEWTVSWWSQYRRNW